MFRFKFKTHERCFQHELVLPLAPLKGLEEVLLHILGEDLGGGGGGDLAKAAVLIPG